MNQKSDKSPNESVDISSETLEHLDQEVQEQQEKIKEQSETLQQTQEELETTSSALEEGRESLELLYKLSRSLVKVVDPAAVASDALELITEALSVLRGEVLLIDERTGKLEVLALVGYSDQEVDTYKQAADMRLNRGLAWKVSQSHEAVALPDVNCSEHWLSIPGLDDDICSAAAIPLLADEKMSGVMTLLSDEFDHLNEDRLELLTAIATQVALALQNAELFVSEQEARRVAEILREANLEMTQSLDVEQVSAISLKYLHALIHYDQAAVVLLPDGRELHILAYRGYETKVEPRPLKGKKLPLEKYPLLQHIIDTKESLVVEDTQEILDWQPVIVGGATRSWVSIPLIAGQGVVGLFTAGKAEADFFHQRDREVAEALAVQTATAIQNGELYE
ncbi:MAG: GAF domain-containing protein, partial [Anaerolineae bacterium]|nr:GAF domain-containing protein [Anaerolineae bacterium]